MTHLKLATYERDGDARAGAIFGDVIVDICELTGEAQHADMIAVLADWDVISTRVRLGGQEQADKTGRLLSSVVLLAPVPRPGALYFTGANYTDHISEMRKLPLAPASEYRKDGLPPWLLLKSSHTVVAPGTKVKIPGGVEKLDWEAELAIVIGRKGLDLDVGEALDVVAGYTIANDLSARDLSRRTQLPDTAPFYYDWMGQKSFDGACPLGPWIVLAEDIPDPQQLALHLDVNGVRKQDSHTSKMIFSVAEQVAYASQNRTLWPGDIILTGTPAGVGAGTNEFLHSGDRVLISIEHIGALEHSIG